LFAWGLLELPFCSISIWGVSIGKDMAISTTEAQTYVTGLYQNILNRAPDPGGYTYWVNDLVSGATEAQVQNAFLNSSEYKGSSSDQAHWANLNAQQTNTISVVSPVEPMAPVVSNVSSGTVVPSSQVAIQAQSNNSTDLFSSIGLPSLAVEGFSSTEVYLGIGAAAVLLFMLSSGRR
jgi:hypothetical protein